MKYLSASALVLALVVPSLNLRGYDAVLTSDTSVDVTVATPANQGAATSLLVSGTGSNYHSVGLAQFNLGTLPAGTTASQVTKATLTVFVDQLLFANGTSGTLYIAPVTAGNWSELASPTISGSANQGGSQVQI